MITSALGGMRVSDDNNLLAFGVDTVSRRQYTVHFKDLSTGEMLADEIPLDHRRRHLGRRQQDGVLYPSKDAQTLRSYQVYRHVLGTSVEEDVLVFEEDGRDVCLWGLPHQERRLLGDLHFTDACLRSTGCWLPTTPLGSGRWCSPASATLNTASATTATISISSPTGTPRTSA